jgi:hypothetical protein
MSRADGFEPQGSFMIKWSSRGENPKISMLLCQRSRKSEYQRKRGKPDATDTLPDLRYDGANADSDVEGSVRRKRKGTVYISVPERTLTHHARASARLDLQHRTRKLDDWTSDLVAPSGARRLISYAFLPKRYLFEIASRRECLSHCDLNGVSAALRTRVSRSARKIAPSINTCPFNSRFTTFNV